MSLVYLSIRLGLLVSKLRANLLTKLYLSPMNLACVWQRNDAEGPSEQTHQYLPLGQHVWVLTCRLVSTRGKMNIMGFFGADDYQEKRHFPQMWSWEPEEKTTPRCWKLYWNYRWHLLLAEFQQMSAILEAWAVQTVWFMEQGTWVKALTRTPSTPHWL